MNLGHLHLWRTPHRLSAFQAKVVAALAIANLAIAATGLILYDGLPRIVHVAALALVGLTLIGTNLAWAAGSLLPEHHGGKPLRRAVVPLALLMLAALVLSVAMLWRGLGGEAVITGMLSALGAILAVQLTREP